MINLSVIILTFNESKHIERCIKNVNQIAEEIFIVDSFSTDNTTVLAQELGAKVFQNEWLHNHATQFNWALENLPIQTEWVLRLDADEYLLHELIIEIQDKLGSLSNDVTGVVFKRRHIFLDKWIKKGTYPVKLVRLFRNKKAICEQRWMDEHIVLLEGRTIEFDHDFVDHNLNNLSWWSQKHVGYAIREAVDLLDLELDLLGKKADHRGLSDQALKKRMRKLKYAKQPLFLRSFIYFLYRYIIKGGFFEGKEGFLWHFLQGWWYRTLVDVKVWEIKKACGNDVQKIREHLLVVYHLRI